MPSIVDGSSRCARWLLCILAVVGACTPRSRRTPDDTLVYLQQVSIRDLDPRFALSSYDMKLSRLIVPGLTTVDDPTMEPRMELAESFEAVDDVTVEVVLKEGLRFSDGTPVTAADVVYTYESTLDPATDSLYRKMWQERFARIEAVDDRRVRFHLTGPLATLQTDLDFGILSAAAAREGRIVGAGAYAIVSVTADRALLERNDYYYGPRPPLRYLEVRAVRDANARLLMHAGGSADLSQNGVRVDLVDEIRARPRMKVISGPSSILTYLMMQTEDPILSDVRVRRAIAHAVDRERIVQAKFDGLAVLATGLLPPGHWAYNGDVPRYDYDPQRAMELLDAAGYPDPDGPGGQPRFRLTYKTSADQFRVAIAHVIASQLGEVGIEVDVRSFEFGTFFTDIKRGNYQIATMQTASIGEPDYYYAYFHSSRIPTEENLGLNNRWRYRSAEVDRLTELGRTTMDREGRIRVYADVQRIVAEDVPVVPLWHEDNIAVMNVDLEGYALFPNAPLRGVETAYKED